MVGRDNGGHDVPAEGRTGLVEVARFRVDVEHRTIRGETGAEIGRDLGDERTADGGCAGKDDLGLMELREGGQDGSVGVVVEILKRGIVGNVHDVGAMGDELLCLALDPLADENSRELCFFLVRELPAFTQKLKGHARYAALVLFCEYPDALVCREVRRGRRCLLRPLDGLELADLHAGAAHGAVLGDERLAVAHLDGAEGAGGQAGLTACAGIRYDSYAHGLLLRTKLESVNWKLENAGVQV